MIQTATKIYALYDPELPLIRYVGKTILPLNTRLNAHITRSRTGRGKSPAHLWVKSLLDRGDRPMIVLLDIAEGEGGEEEKLWITKFDSLTNVRAGGNGKNQQGGFPDEWRDKLGVWSDQRIAEQLGRSREFVKYHRNIAGIPQANDRSRSAKPPKKKITYEFSNEIISRLGTVSDIILAKELGMTKAALAERRKKLGIPAFTGNNRPRGVNHWKTTLTTEKIQSLKIELTKYEGRRMPYGVTERILTDFGVTKDQFHRIRAGKTWADIK